MVKVCETHRPGIWKQDNKVHKHGKHRSKGAVEAANRGRVTVKQITTNKNKNLSRSQRKNQLLQLRTKKREETVALKRALGKTGSPPFLVAVVALSPYGTDIDSAIEVLKSCDETAVAGSSQNGTLHISVPRFKQRYSFVIPKQGHLGSIMDAVKVADTVMLIHSIEEGYEEESIVTALFAQGLPTTVHVFLGQDPKRHDKMKLVKERLEKKFPKEKLMPLSTPQEAILVLRQIGNQKQRPVVYRNHRFHFLAEAVEYECDQNKEEGVLRVTGYIRGRPLDVNGLVHIPGCGTYQLKQVDELKDPHPCGTSRMFNEEMDEGPVTIAVPDVTRQQTLESEIVPDTMNAEQTWPTEEEIQEASKKRFSKKVPKGTSDYQASWIVDSENDEESDISEYEDVNMEDDDMAAHSGSDESDDEEESEQMYDTESHQSEMVEDYDAKFDVDMEAKELEKFKAAKGDALFPDEVDTPVDQLARTRFQKYRGLRSFRKSPWDRDENLPLDYARIYRFKSYEQTRKKVLKDDTVDGIEPGRYVTLHIVNVSKTSYESLKFHSPLVVYGLLNHEQKMSVVNLLLKRFVSPNEEPEPIQSKEKLIFHVGYRRFSACPLFSQHTLGDKHKYERYFRADISIVATVYAPIVFSPCPVLVFKELETGEQKLVAVGKVLDTNPNRIILKRIVLSGSPFKINRRSAVIRYMFFKREDINWFKPVELRTKEGRVGHIKEPLGTHGHMKCTFNKPLRSQDTVLLKLYKRIYPKWTYDPSTPEHYRCH
ncbi:ribosome bioproteinsis protein tsr1 [Chamberlinius hualienensis]